MIQWNKEEVERVFASEFSTDGFVYPNSDISVQLRSEELIIDLYLFQDSESCWIRSMTAPPSSRQISEFGFRCDLINVATSHKSDQHITHAVRFHFTDGSHSPSNDTIRFSIDRTTNGDFKIWGVIGEADPLKPREIDT